LKILQINAVNKIESTGRTVTEMAKSLREKGFVCVTAYSAGPSVLPEYEYRIGSRFDTKLHGLLSRAMGKQGYFSHSATRHLLHFMDEFAPDVVILRNLHANYIQLPMLLKYLAEKDIPTVVVLHDCWFYTGKCCHYTVAGCHKWLENCGDCPALKDYNKSWFFDKTAQMLADKKALFGAIPRLGVVGVSNWLTDEARKSAVFQNAKCIQRIYNWVDTETFAPRNVEEVRQKLGTEGKKVILCVASTWRKEKGLDTVLQLTREIQKDKQRLLLVGGLPQGIVLPDTVIHVRKTYNLEELVSYYCLADVFVQPSPEESFGKVTAEALSCGTPVVSFDSTANPELVGKGCGAVVPVGDTAAFIREVFAILEKGKSQYAECCRNFALQNFNKEKNIQQYIQLFESLCQ
jgi:glycosyltransferase involved in cell wall biosynthesis